MGEQAAHNQDASEKAATLTLKLKAASGYQQESVYKVSANQWGAIIAICEGGDSAPGMTDDLCAYFRERVEGYRRLMHAACDAGDFKEAARLRDGMQAISAIGIEIAIGRHEGCAAIAKSGGQ